MKNGEYLETLSGIERDNEVIKQVHKWTPSPFFLDYGKCYQEWINEEHITTADEDFAAIGFVIETTQPLYVCYADDNGRLLYVLKNNNEYDTNNEGWNDELINTVRTIADKKRDEMGW